MGWQITCSSCNSSLSTKDYNKGQGTSLPHILLCGHSVCGLCVKRGIHSLALICNICGVPTPTTESSTPKDFPLNAYIFGSSQLQTKPPAVTRIMPSGAVIQSTKCAQKQSKDTLCCECYGQRGGVSLRCLECDLLYCKICFNKIHSFKALQSHHEQPVGMAMIKPLRCPAHKEAKDFLFCKNCEDYMCHTCFLFEHRDHSFAQIKEKNGEFIPKIKTALAQAQVVRERLLRARKEAEKPTLRQRSAVHGIEDVKKAVGVYMAQLHGYLQLKESEIFMKLGMLEQNVSLSLGQTLAKVEEQMKEIDSLVDAANYTLVQESITNVDLGDVLNKVEKLADLPCFFTEETASEDASVTFKEDKTILELISNLDVDVKNGCKYCLVREKDLPEGYELKDVVEDAAGDAAVGTAVDWAAEGASLDKDKDSDESGNMSDVSSITSLELAKGSSHMSSSVGSVGQLDNVVQPTKKHSPPQNRSQVSQENQRLLQLAARNRSKNPAFPSSPGSARPNATEHSRNMPPGRTVDVSSLVTGDSIDVKLSYIYDPCNFFVQAMSSARTLRQLNIDMFEMAVNNKLAPVDDNLSGLYLAFIKDNIWSRARVLKTSHGGTMVEVLCVDTGVVRNIPTSSLRKLPSRAASLPPFASRCKLYDLTIEDSSRLKEASEYFYRITRGKCLRMDVMNMSDGILHVDLRFKEDDKKISAGTSIRDVLLLNSDGAFLGSAKKLNGQSSLLRPVSIFDTYSIGDSFRGVCTHADSPKDVYFQRADGNDTKCLPKMIAAMTQLYNDANIGDQMHAPIPGMLCASLYQDGLWYRAEVVELCPEQKVRVRYIDFGNQEMVHWKNLRVLHPEFAHLRVLVVPCEINDMECSKKKDVIKFVRSITATETPFQVEVVGKSKDKLIVNVLVMRGENLMDVRDILKMRKKPTDTKANDNESSDKVDSASSGTEEASRAHDETDTKELLKAHDRLVKPMAEVIQPTVAKTSQKDVSVVAAPKDAVAGVFDKIFDKFSSEDSGVEVPATEHVKIGTTVGAIPIQERVTNAFTEKDVAEAQAKTDVAEAQAKQDVADAQAKEDAADAQRKKEVTKAPAKEVACEASSEKGVAETPPKKNATEAPTVKDTAEVACKTDVAATGSIAILPADEPVSKTGGECHAKEEKASVVEKPKGVVKEEGAAMKADPEVKPGRIKIELLRAESPSRLFVMFSGLKSYLSKMRENMKQYYEKDPPAEGWQPTLLEVCAFLSQDNGWYRGRVTSVSEDKKTVEVFLVDWGRSEKGPVKNLRVLDAQYAKVRITGSFRCHLADITAPGGTNEWPAATKEFLNDELKENANNLFMAMKGEVENYTVPIILWVKKIVVDALEPTREEWYTMNQFLCDEGLALPLPGLKGGEYSCENPFEEESWSYELYESVDDFYEEEEEKETVKEARVVYQELILPPSPESDVPIPEPVLPSEVKPHVSSGEPSESWLPAEPVKGRFIAQVTYLDANCCIYLHNEKRARKLAALTQRLSRKYNGSPVEDDVQWEVGQICIAQYHLDKMWYRATVKEVISPDELVVAFVDYGNVEHCHPSQLRANPVETALPIQCIKCRLDGVVPVPPKTEWTDTEIDYLHNIIVDKRCSVLIVRGPTQDDDCYMVDLTTMDGNPVCKFLLDAKFANLCPSTASTSSYLPSPAYSDYESDDDVVVLAERISESSDQPEVTDEARRPPESPLIVKKEPDESQVDLEVSNTNATGTPSECDLSVANEDSVVVKESIDDIINASIIMVNEPKTVISSGADAVDVPPETDSAEALGPTDSPAQSIDRDIETAESPSDSGSLLGPSAAATHGSNPTSPNKHFEVFFPVAADNRLMKPSDFLSHPPKETNPHTELLTAAARRLDDCTASPDPQSEAKQTQNPENSQPLNPVKDWMKVLFQNRSVPSPGTIASIGRGRFVDCSKRPTD